MKHVYVFGAGASNASAHAPLGKDLVWNYYEDCSTLYQIEYGKPTTRDIDEKSMEFINFKKFLVLADEIFPELKEVERWLRCMNNAEMYMPPAYNNKRYYVDDLLAILIEGKRDDAIGLVRQLILEHITESIKGSGNILYKKFLLYLFNQKINEISVITLNFDTLLLDHEYEQQIFDYGIKFNWKDPNCDKWHHHKNGIPLIKLNGSLDWGICNECQKIACFTPHVSKRTYTDVKCYMTPNCDGRLTPLIVLPHENPQPISKILLEMAKKQLSMADKITIIGYSFPEYDLAIKTLFHEHVNKSTEIEIVDLARREDQEKKKRHFMYLFGSQKTKIIYDGFEGYLNN